MQNKILSRIINIKDIEKEQLELEVNKKKHVLNEEQKRLGSLEEKMEEAIDELTNINTEGELNISRIDYFYTHLSDLKGQIESQKKNILKKKEDLEEKQLAMLEAYKEKRLLEIFRDKMFSEEIRSALINEQKEMDFNYLLRRLRQ